MHIRNRPEDCLCATSILVGTATTILGESSHRDPPVGKEAHMPGIGLMPNAVSSRTDKAVYLVVDRVGSPRDLRYQTKVQWTDIETIISDLIEGQFNDPLRVVTFNTLGRWLKDISRDLAEEIQIRCDVEAMPVPEHIRDFVASYMG
jgi:hypothetical protein